MEQSTFRLLYPEGRRSPKDKGMKDYDFVRMLEIDVMVVIPQNQYRGISGLKLEEFYTTDTYTLQYRLDIMQDILEHEELYQLFTKALPLIQSTHDLRRIMSSDFTVDSSLSSIRTLEMYVELVDLFDAGLSGVQLHSAGMQRLQQEIRHIAKGEEYQNLAKELKKMETNFGSIKSLTIGINLDENLQVHDGGIISVNTKHFHNGTLLERLTGKQEKDPYACMTPLFPVKRGLTHSDTKSLNNGMSNAFGTIFSKCIRDFEPTVQKYFSVNTAFFTNLMDDLRFLCAGARFIMKMKQQGYTMCKPQIASVEEKCCDLEGVYNPILAMKGVEKTVVSNEFHYDENGRFYLVTGPNHGGKSIFAYSIGMAQALFQLGLYVPAVSARISPVTSIFTHFPSSDEDNYGKGRLESECARLSRILMRLEETDILLMDETFSSTSGLEAGYIASEVLTGLGIIGCGGIYVTHIHDLPQRVAQFNAHSDNKGKIDNLVAQMVDRENGVRSYRVTRTTPDGLSYAKDIAGQYGLTLEEILKEKNNKKSLLNKEAK